VWLYLHKYLEQINLILVDKRTVVAFGRVEWGQGLTRKGQRGIF